MKQRGRVSTVVCPFCLMDVVANTHPTLSDLLDYKRTRTYIEQQLEAAGHIDWHVEQMIR